MINRGQIVGDTFCKRVKFSKAVLWKDRQISLPQGVMDSIIKNGVTKIMFVDAGKGENWTFKTEKVLEAMVLKQEGQEPQYYFPIELATKKGIK